MDEKDQQQHSVPEQADQPATDAEQAQAAEALEPGETEAEALFPAPEQTAAPAEEDGRKRRVLRRKPKRTPEQTRDDTDAGWGELFDDSAHDRWLKEQRPPHWGKD